MDKCDAKVISVNVSNEKGVKKTPVSQGTIKANFGILGDAHAGAWHRQVSLLSIESIEKMKDRGVQGLTYGSFAENITTMGIKLHELPIGTRLSIGETVHEVTQIGKTCHNDCSIKEEAGYCIMPTEGIFTKVILGGQIKAGDLIRLLE